ncbi:hypothetical protein [Pedosphaera parvula]|uniref:Uncharacterized protein n=1 Tax=Pedosphaera parvula (strain Ellin514) TaxID=320771 RepID=B9XNM2_PEDPL|nr:hypothetical protein [Pedosphaera parvula]EEF58562.1 hypothetical protein Cflav_PD1752 [Pedosphaera parvula Ellin514]
MKKISVLVLILGFVVGFKYFSKRQPESAKQVNIQEATPELNERVNPVKHKSSRQNGAPESGELTPVVATPTPTPATEVVAVAQKQPVSTVITNTAADFAKGETNNVILSNGLMQLGDDATPTTFQSNYKLFGIFHSLPQDLPAPIDRVFPNYQATIPDGGSLMFAFRTRSADGNWSTWTEVNPDQLNEPFMLESPGVSLQYKLSLFGNDAATSPKIASVLMGTQTAAEPAESPNAGVNNAPTQ